MQAQLILQECMNELIQNQDNEKLGALTEKLKDLLTLMAPDSDTERDDL